MKRLCPICQNPLTEENRIKYIDYHCRDSGGDEHHLTQRIKDNEIKKMKIRFKESNGEKIYLKIHFDENYMEVWTGKHITRTNIQQVFQPDFTQINKLKEKIRTYLLFS